MKLLSRIGRGLACAVGSLAMFAAVGCMHDDPAQQLSGLPQGTGFMIREVNGHKYSVFIPRDYASKPAWPTMVFLHGVGESGSDGINCRTVGLGPEIARHNGSFPFIVVFPQTGWDWTTSDSEKIMLDALNDAEQHYNIDRNQICLTGMSSGGRGTWVLGARHPEIFSCLVPMAGFAATDEAPKLAKMSVYVLHNEDDGIVNVSNTRDMIDAIHKCGGQPTVEIFPPEGKGHDCWDEAYSEGKLFNWVLGHRLNQSGNQAPPSVSIGNNGSSAFIKSVPVK